MAKSRRVSNGWEALVVGAGMFVLGGCGGGANGRDSHGATLGPGTNGDTETSGSPGDDETGEPEVLEDDAEIVSIEHDGVMACGQWGWVNIILRNSGINTWSDASGYALGVVGADPFTTENRIALPPGIEVAPGGTWQFDVAIQAPGSDGQYATSWQMVRQDTTFGPIASGQIEVDCSVPLPEVPDVFDVIQAVAAEYGYLLEINTYESCGEFIQRVLMALDDPDWGHVGKTAGEAQHTPASFEAFYVEEHLITGFSHDVIYHRPSNRQIDIIIAAAARSDPNPEIWQDASIGWDVIPPEHYRDNNPWIPAVPVDDEGGGGGGGAVLGPGQSLGPDGFRRSTDGRFELRYQGDGNLVLTHLGVGALWAEDASINNPGSFTLELDGDLTIRNGGGQIVWTSNTAGNPDASLHVQDDGNVVLYANGSGLWSTGTCCH